MLNPGGYTLYPIREVTQTKLGFPEGNCFAACIASVLRMTDAEIELGLPSLCIDGGVGDDRASAWLDSLSDMRFASSRSARPTNRACSTSTGSSGLRHRSSSREAALLVLPATLIGGTRSSGRSGPA